MNGNNVDINSHQFLAWICYLLTNRSAPILHLHYHGYCSVLSMCKLYCLIEIVANKCRLIIKSLSSQPFLLSWGQKQSITCFTEVNDTSFSIFIFRKYFINRTFYKHSYNHESMPCWIKNSFNFLLNFKNNNKHK